MMVINQRVDRCCNRHGSNLSCQARETVLNMRFGVSYFGVRNPQHTERDLDDMVRLGFDYVVLTFSEHDHRFYQESVATCAEQAHERGLTVWVDPWGVGGIFGGEAFSDLGAWQLEAQQQRRDGRSLPLLCPASEAARDYLRHWVKTVAEVLRAEAIFWDEPHFYLPLEGSEAQGLWSCACVSCREGFEAAYGYALPSTETAAVRQWKQNAVAALLEEVTAMAAGYGLRNMVCVQPDDGRLDGLEAKLERFAANPNLDVLSTDPYPLLYGQPIESTRGFCEALLRSCQRHGKAPQMWIQGFGVSAGDEHLPGEEIELMAACGITDIAVWSYLATAYMSSHVCADSERVWHVVTQAMQKLKNAWGQI